ncbi:hypothetical protein [Lactiplantibacillus daowaiensis]|uniref:Integral membrane protein n=1 Tax=Lactiplantibacillus daowaiensis TaxID=2559918 RepID=A0ABW1S4F1_9LACO|nr:hypothetical protein [Lactiplantibacillus daowaiensis]
MTKFESRLTLVSGWAALLTGLLGPWLMLLHSGFGIGTGFVSVIITELYFDLRWSHSRWGQLGALAVAAGVAVFEIVYFLLVAAYLQ